MWPLDAGIRSLAGWLAIALGSALLGAAASRADVKVADAFPVLSPEALVDLAGGKIPDTAGRVVLVDFWASWCAPCKASFPMMARLHQEFSSRGLLVVAVGIDEKPDAATAFWRKLNPPFTTLHDRTQSLVKRVGVPTMPTSYLIGRDGRVRFIHHGFHGEKTERELRKELAALLDEKASP